MLEYLQSIWLKRLALKMIELGHVFFHVKFPLLVKLVKLKSKTTYIQILYKSTARSYSNPPKKMDAAVIFAEDH